ncbi:MAG: ATP-binding protein [Bacteroidales bacterium]|nr:ATP-binding protein [Bacteroidales bacterium]
MIQSLKIKNFLSFKDEVEISFDASKDKDLEDYHVVEVAPGVRLLKFLVVYGYNASGKSNLIKAFEFLKAFWSNTPDKDENTDVIPFLLNNENRNQPSEFSLDFYSDNIKFIYNLVVDSKQVIKEKLDFYPSSQPANVFVRDTINGVSVIEYGSKIKLSTPVRNEIEVKCLSNTSVMAAYNQVNASVKEIESFSQLINKNLSKIITPKVNLKGYAENLFLEDSKTKGKIVNYLKRADFNIHDVKVEQEESDFFDNAADFIEKLVIPQYSTKIELNDIFKDKLNKTTFHHKVENKGLRKSFPLPLEYQSEGTIRIFGLSAAVYKALEQNAFLAIDEIESKLHPQLIEYLIEEFLKESKESQLLVATHYDNLFDQDDLLRKDNFWFTEKQDDGSTKLYGLKHFSGLNRISSLQKAYKFGKFGATPNLE